MIDKEQTYASLDEETSFVLRDRERYPEAQVEDPFKDGGQFVAEEGVQVAAAGKAGRFLKGILAKAKPKRRTRDIMSEFYAKPEPKKFTGKELQDALGTVDAPPIKPGETPPVKPADAPPIRPGETPPAKPVETPDVLDEAATRQKLEDLKAEPSPDPIGEKRTDERNINIQRHHEGAMANADELAAMSPEDALSKIESADDIGKLMTLQGREQDPKGVRTHAEIEARTDSTEKVKKELAGLFDKGEEAIGALTDVQLHGVRRMMSTLGDETVALAKRIEAGDESLDTLLAFQKKSKAFESVYDFTSGKVTEAARALSQQNMIAKTLTSADGASLDVRTLKDFINNTSGSPEDMVIAASNMARSADKTGNMKSVADSFKPEAKDYFAAAAEFYTHNLISGAETYMVNGISSGLARAYNTMLVKPVAATLGAAKQAVGKQSYDRVSAEEIGANMAAGTVGLFDGIMAMGPALKGDPSWLGKGKGHEVQGAMSRVLGYHMGPKGEKAADMATLGFRGLAVTDALWKTGILRSELTGRAVRDAMARGVDVNKHIDDVLTNPRNYPDIFNGAMKEAQVYTFLETDRPGLLGDLGRASKQFLKSHPYLKFITPFVDTPLNLLHFAVENSPAGPLSKQLRGDLAAGGARADLAAAKVAVGASAWYAAYSMYDAGMLTPGGDYGVSKLTEQLGGKSESLLIDGKYYTIDRLDPLAMSMMGLVNSIDRGVRANTEDGFIENLGEGITGMAGHALDATFMVGLNDFLNVVRGDKSFSSWVAGQTTGFIPYSGAMRTATKLTDPQPRSARQKTMGQKMGAAMKSIVPGLSDELPPRRYWDGTPVTPRGGKPVHQMDITDRLMNAISPIKVVEPSDQAKYDKPTQKLLENGISPRDPAPEITLNGVSFNLYDFDETGHVFDLYVETVGKARRDAISTSIKSKQFKDMPAGHNSEQRAILLTAMAKAQQRGRKEFLKDVLPRFVRDHPDLVTEMAEAAGGAGGRNLRTLIQMAKKDQLKESLQEKVTVKKAGDQGGLPLPPHLDKPEQSSPMPEF